MDDPKLISGEDLKKTNILSGSIDLFDINILPMRYRQKRLRLVTVLPWLLFIILLASLYPSGIMALEEQDSYNQIRNELIQIQASMEIYQTASDEMDTLLSEIDAAEQQRDQILESYQGIDLQGTNWSEVLFQIEKAAPSGITWTLISQQENEILLEGVSVDYPVILNLVDALAALDKIKSVQIESIDKVVEVDQEVIAPEGDEEIPSLPTKPPSYFFTIRVLTSGESQP